MQLHIVGLDHIVLNVADGERALQFYCDVLGLKPERVEEWRRKEVPFPSVRVNESVLIDLMVSGHKGENLDHFCLVIDPTDLEELSADVDLHVFEGPLKRFGARGVGMSVYLHDPDGNRIELRYYD